MPAVHLRYSAEMRAALTLCVLVASLGLPAPAQPPGQVQKAGAWEPLEFLMGDWTGDGSGSPGQGIGGFTFRIDLQQAVVVRTNQANYPAAKDRPAFTHDDLMVIYRDPANAQPHAIYFDNEGHVIHYAVSFGAGRDTVQFLSDAGPGVPRYKLTYTTSGAADVAIKFEIAPPEKPEAFATYIEAKARRKSAQR